MYVGGFSVITNGQEDKSIWKILAMENWPPDSGFKFTIAFEKG